MDYLKLDYIKKLKKKVYVYIYILYIKNYIYKIAKYMI